AERPWIVRHIGGDDLMPWVHLNAIGLLLGCDRFDRQVQPPFFADAIGGDRFGPKLFAIGADGVEINPLDFYSPEPTIACCVVKVSVFIGRADEDALTGIGYVVASVWLQIPTKSPGYSDMMSPGIPG